MTQRFLFIGERPSALAHKMQVNWTNGRLAAKQLFDALLACGLDPARQRFINLFHDHADEVNPVSLQAIRRAKLPTVAMGKKVAALVTTDHQIVHPAARGRIRKKERYIEHIRTILIGE